MDFFIMDFLLYGMYGLLYLAGLTVALVYWRRCPKACAWLFTASLLGLLANLTRVGLQLHFVNRDDIVVRENIVPFTKAMYLTSIVQWIAHGLLLLAVFAGRNEPPFKERSPRPLSDDDGDWPPSISKPSTDVKGR